MSSTDAALAVSITGIVVSGVVGPQLTVWATRRANRRQFNRDQAVARKDELRLLLDEAAALLASGATNLRLLRESEQRQVPPDAELSNWLGRVFPLGVRLRLRLPAGHDVLTAYDEVREALVQTAASTRDIESAITDFERRRDAFLDLSRAALNAEIPETG